MGYLKLGTGLVFVALLSWFVWYFHTLVDKSKDYMTLQGTNAQLMRQHNIDEASAAKAAIELVASEAARKQALGDFESWKAGQLLFTDKLRGMIHASPVSTNPICAPTVSERKLWNDTLYNTVH